MITSPANCILYVDRGTDISTTGLSDAVLKIVMSEYYKNLLWVHHLVDGTQRPEGEPSEFVDWAKQNKTFYNIAFLYLSGIVGEYSRRGNIHYNTEFPWINATWGAINTPPKNCFAGSAPKIQSLLDVLGLAPRESESTVEVFRRYVRDLDLPQTFTMRVKPSWYDYDIYGDPDCTDKAINKHIKEIHG